MPATGAVGKCDGGDGGSAALIAVDVAAGVDGFPVRAGDDVSVAGDVADADGVAGAEVRGAGVRGAEPGDADLAAEPVGRAARAAVVAGVCVDRGADGVVAGACDGAVCVQIWR